MPPLLAAVREALTESIRCHGVVVPVVKDQDGYVLDGHHRITIAAELGVDYPEVIHECEPEQREILRIELNGARRQIGPEEWKPLVDHLRAQVNDEGVRCFSDRVIARAVGVDQGMVKRYKSPPATPFESDDSNGIKVTKEDGKTYTVGGKWRATDRILHLVRQSAGLTAEELYQDEILAEFPRSTISKIPGMLRNKGLLRATGKRGDFTIWTAVSEGAAQPRTRVSATVRKAERVLEDIADPEVRNEVKAQLTDRKELRQAEAALRAAEKELKAAIEAEEQREADKEKEQLRMTEVARRQADKSLKTWDKLISEIHASWVVIGAYMKVFDHLPAIHPSYRRLLDTELAELRRQMDWFDRRLHPNGHNTVTRGDFIDI